ncbi:MAG TPA: hypothetical protein VGD14_09540 [bacterium]
MNEFLKNKKTGQVVRKNQYNSQEADMVLCIAPWDTPAISCAMSGKLRIPEELAATTTLDEPASDLLPKDIAENLVVELFGKPVAEVDKKEMIQYAIDNGVDVKTRYTKLEIMTAINKSRSQQGSITHDHLRK